MPEFDIVDPFTTEPEIPVDLEITKRIVAVREAAEALRPRTRSSAFTAGVPAPALLAVEVIALADYIAFGRFDALPDPLETGTFEEFFGELGDDDEPEPEPEPEPEAGPDPVDYSGHTPTDA